MNPEVTPFLCPFHMQILHAEQQVKWAYKAMNLPSYASWVDRLKLLQRQKDIWWFTHRICQEFWKEK